jgi:mannose/fructose/N-acetylgalactosamine-specific phosphotransferase system component IIB
MSIDLVRIDNRLVHGQVIEAWVPFTQADRIVVVDDDVAQDPLKRSILELATPQSIRLDICSVEQAVELYRSGTFEDTHTIILFANPQEAYHAFLAGFAFDTLNVGNLHYAVGKQRVSPSVCCNEEELEILRGFARRGVVVEVRALPRESSRTITADWESATKRP